MIAAKKIKLIEPGKLEINNTPDGQQHNKLYIIYIDIFWPAIKPSK
jgi:hypothetical protein